MNLTACLTASAPQIRFQELDCGFPLPGKTEAQGKLAIIIGSLTRMTAATEQLLTACNEGAVGHSLDGVVIFLLCVDVGQRLY